MNNEMFITAEEVANDFGVSKGYAYTIVKRLNDELKEKGYLTVCGRVNRQYYTERIYKGNKEGTEANACI